ncbi:hypothetical protein HYH02_014113 [Chlamydomonas schloesseri]|uniref:Uncharacterized protein n=1 Tax=Chlamydomonas schloesseri TaxID=2026947 RepID=A0A835VX71_9CHLO|nr:hypothetical protein HYH02_014113 [Chlamydomonas schloesseri]|eukprot:KAG2429178.1 hypothetical protein HYH02_014113 [Chlamydomonas schloesseri]
MPLAPSSSPAQMQPPSRLGPSASSSPALLSRPAQAPRASQSAATPARCSPPAPGASVTSSVARKPWSSPALLPPTQHQHAPRGVAALRQHVTTAAAAAASPVAAAAGDPAAGSSPGLRAPVAASAAAAAKAGIVRGLGTSVAVPALSGDLATRLDALLLAEDLMKLLVGKAVEQAEAKRAAASGRDAGGGGGMSLSPRWWGRRGAEGMVVLELGDEEGGGDGDGGGRARLLPSCGCSVM